MPTNMYYITIIYSVQNIIGLGEKSDKSAPLKLLNRENKKCTHQECVKKNVHT